MKAFDPSKSAPSAPGPDDRLALGAQRVGQAGHERRLGPDDVEVGLDVLDRGVGHRDGRRPCPGCPA